MCRKISLLYKHDKVIKIGNTKVRTVSGQRTGLANQDSQISSLDSGRRTLASKKRSTGEETSSPARVKKISGPSSDTRSSSSGPRHSRILTPCSDSSLVRTQRPVNVHGNNLSRVQSTRVTPDNVDAIVLLALERIDKDEGLTFEVERQIPKRGIFPWRKRKLCFRSFKAKGEPLLKRDVREEGGDDIDFDRQMFTSSDESLYGEMKVQTILIQTGGWSVQRF